MKKFRRRPWQHHGAMKIDAGKRARYHALVVAEIEVVVCCLALIQSDAAIFHAHFESMPAMGPGEVVDNAESRSNFDVCRLVRNIR